MMTKMQSYRSGSLFLLVSNAEAPMRQRVLWFVGLSMAMLMIAVGWGPLDVSGPVVAQEPPADPGAAAPAEPAAAPAEAPAAKEEPPAATQESALAWFYRSLGLPYVVIFLAMSFVLVALFIMNLLSSRRDNVCPTTLIEAFEAHLNERKYQEAYELAKADESFLGQMLAAGMAKISSGYEKAMQSMSYVGEEENMKLEHRLGYMALIGTLAPMVGLFGTVDGMIRAFIVIARTNTTPKPAELAAGISTALVTTVVGLALAIPAMAAFNIMKNRVARLVFEVGVVSEGLMSRFEGVSQSSGK
jgi:biopolymer transport protein ExbB